MLVGMTSSTNYECTTDMKIEISKALSFLATDKQVKDEIKTAGGTKLLLELLGGSSNEVLQEWCAVALKNVTQDSDENRKFVAEMGAAAIVIHLSSANPKILENVTLIMEQLCMADVSRSYIYTIGGIPALVAILQNRTNRSSCVDLRIETDPSRVVSTPIIEHALHCLVLLTQAVQGCDAIVNNEVAIVTLTNILTTFTDDAILQHSLQLFANVEQHHKGTVLRLLVMGALPSLLKNLVATALPVQRVTLELLAYMADSEEGKNAIRYAST